MSLFQRLDLVKLEGPRDYQQARLHLGMTIGNIYTVVFGSSLNRRLLAASMGTRHLICLEAQACGSRSGDRVGTRDGQYLSTCLR